MEIRLCNIRITGRDKNYYMNQLQVFASKFSHEKIICVDFGKQDIRGTYSITLIDKRHCVPRQKFFSSKDMMLGFVLGYNQYFNASVSHDEFSEYFNPLLKVV